MKKSLTAPLVLAFVDFGKPIIVGKDASSSAVGAALSQKQPDGKIHPVQYSSSNINLVKKRYSACERETLEVIFGLRNILVYLLFSHPFELITEHQSLKDDFIRKEIHGRLARWLNIIVKYGYIIWYRPGKMNGSADGLSRLAVETRFCTDHNEGDLLLSVGPVEVVDDAALESHLTLIRTYLSMEDFSYVQPKDRLKAKRADKNFVVLYGHLFRCTKGSPRIVAGKADSTTILRFLHDIVGHWDDRTTFKVMQERFWSPKMVADVYSTFVPKKATVMCWLLKTTHLMAYNHARPKCDGVDRHKV